MTTAWTREGQVAVFIAVDNHNAECVGLHAARHGTRSRHSNRSGREYADILAASRAALSIRHDHGSQYMSAVFQGEIAFLGVESSPAFVRAPEGNKCAERFIRTLKENLLWVHTFDTGEDLRCALLASKDSDNMTWMIGCLGHRTPAAVRKDLFSTAAMAA